MATYFVPSEDLTAFLGTDSTQIRCGPVRGRPRLDGGAEPLWLEVLDPTSPVDSEALKRPRPAQSVKGLLFPAAEAMGQYGPAADGTATAVEAPPTVLIGVRACELRAATYFDKVMLGGEFADPAYRRRREAMTSVSTDCVDCADSCFCTLVGGRPFATEGFDVNLTPLDDGWLLEVATEKGNTLIGDTPPAEATPEQLARRERVRSDMTERVAGQNAAFGFTVTDAAPAAMPEGDDPAWSPYAGDCVECGACTNICPTCHCFYLYDQALGPERFERVRTWDSCLLGTYHRMAGGVNIKATPHPSLTGRLANRVLHKMVYSPQQYSLLGCTGCGRCVDACLGGLDVRTIIAAVAAPDRETA